MWQANQQIYIIEEYVHATRINFLSEYTNQCVNGTKSTICSIICMNRVIKNFFKSWEHYQLHSSAIVPRKFGRSAYQLITDSYANTKINKCMQSIHSLLAKPYKNVLISS